MNTQAAKQRNISNKPVTQNKTSFGEATHYLIRIVVEEDKSYYYAKDHLGTIRTTINMMGETENAMDYFPYGQEIPDRNFFVDGAELTNEYEYDDNGNMKTDRNKGIKVMYNYLNLPSLVTWDNSKAKTWWLYTATGEKIRSAVYDEENELAKSNDYVNGFVYKRNDFEVNPVFDFLQFEEGRYLAEGTGYEYHLKDHLGNVRATFDETGSVLDRNFYYPFGITIHNSLSANENRYLYNNKEYETDNNLNWYHYGARFYNPQLGRWHTMDPADEFQSPYLYVGNNPIKLIDPDGRQCVLKGDFSFENKNYLNENPDNLKGTDLGNYLVQRWYTQNRESFDKLLGPLGKYNTLVNLIPGVSPGGEYPQSVKEAGFKGQVIFGFRGDDLSNFHYSDEYLWMPEGLTADNLQVNIYLNSKIMDLTTLPHEWAHFEIIHYLIRNHFPMIIPAGASDYIRGSKETGTQHWQIYYEQGKWVPPLE